MYNEWFFIPRKIGERKTTIEAVQKYEIGYLLLSKYKKR
jgi:hypothetical protein